MTKFSEKFFCPLPWSQIYQHINGPGPCAISPNYDFNMSPEEYINSDWLKQTKKDMLEGKVPEHCRSCKKKEEMGLKSTRGAIWQRYYNVGPEPNYEDMWFYNKFTEVDSPMDIRRLEFRFSNLCNMKCRMCNETNSSEWMREKIEHNIPFMGNDVHYEDAVITTNPEYVEGLKKIALEAKNLVTVCFTGGEPFLIKEYYDYLDFLIEHGLNKKISIELYTNCTVYNPLFIDRLMQFKEVKLMMSIDAYGKSGAYIRHGVAWNKVEDTVRKINALGKPFTIGYNTAISSYALLDASSLATFLMDLYKSNPKIFTKCYHSLVPTELNLRNLPMHLRARALDEIEKASEILTVPNFKILATEFKNIAKILKNNPPKDPAGFVRYTKQFDGIRSENFEETYGIALEE